MGPAPLKPRASSSGTALLGPAHGSPGSPTPHTSSDHSAVKTPGTRQCLSLDTHFTRPPAMGAPGALCAGARPLPVRRLPPRAASPHPGCRGAPPSCSLRRPVLLLSRSKSREAALLCQGTPLGAARGQGPGRPLPTQARWCVPASRRPDRAHASDLKLESVRTAGSVLQCPGGTHSRGRPRICRAGCLGSWER